MDGTKTSKSDTAARRKPREGWAEQFSAMAERGDDKLIDPETPTVFDETEWEWFDDADGR